MTTEVRTLLEEIAAYLLVTGKGEAAKHLIARIQTALLLEEEE